MKTEPVDIVAESESRAIRIATDEMHIAHARILRVEDLGDEGRARYRAKGWRTYRLHIR